MAATAETSKSVTAERWRTRSGAAVLLLGLAWLTVIVLSALAGGWQWGGLSVTSSKPLRFALLTLAMGWWLVPPSRRAPWVERLTSRQALTAGLAFALGYGVLFKVSRWVSLSSPAFDLTLFESTLHHTLQGRFMYAWGLNRSLFSEHFEPIVLFHLPVWALFRHPLVLMLSQSVAVTLAAVPLYRSARVLGLNAGTAALLSTGYLLNPIVWESNSCDFHPELFAPLALFWALWASLQRRWWQLYAAVFFALTLKEELGLAVACFAPLLLKGPGAKRWPHAVAVAALGVVWAVLCFKLIMPAAHPEALQEHPLAGRWARFGHSVPEIAVSLLAHPAYLFSTVFSPTVARVFGSLGMVPLLDPLSVLAAMPPMLVHLTSDFDAAAKLSLYYGILPTTLLVVGALFGVERVFRRWGARAAYVAALLPVVSAPSWLFLSRPTAADLHAAAFIANLPADATVCAQSPLVARVRPPDARRLALVPYCESPEWVLLVRGRDFWPMSAAEHEAAMRQYVGGADFTVAFDEQDYVFVRRSAAQQ